MNNWNKIHLPLNLIALGNLLEIEEALNEAHLQFSKSGINENGFAVIIASLNANGRDIFFSPAISGHLMNLIAKFEGEKCNKPPKQIDRNDPETIMKLWYGDKMVFSSLE
jgi:hypothetical protein